MFFSKFKVKIIAVWDNVEKFEKEVNDFIQSDEVKQLIEFKTETNCDIDGDRLYLGTIIYNDQAGMDANYVEVPLGNIEMQEQE